MTLPRQVLLDRLAADTTAFGQLLECSDLERRITACPDWDLRALAHHLGNVHRWAAAATRSDSPPEEPTDEPAGRAELVEWYRAGAQALLVRLTEASPDEPCWHFGAKPRTVGWWLRRQTHETAVHLWDAQDAVGTGMALDATFAADGVDEVLDVFVPRQLRMGRIEDLAGALRLVATDALLDRVLGSGDHLATVTGPASDLLLLLWKRVPLDALDVTGDPRPVLSAGLVP